MFKVVDRSNITESMKCRREWFYKIIIHDYRGGYRTIYALNKQNNLSHHPRQKTIISQLLKT